ncbi:MAG: hypothetical protein JWQ87_2263 [Candidatus Sulfotelmatobacter sp.]|nr:hypothetical protein [Candidatus Sulfotelmatobacter sp.]
MVIARSRFIFAMVLAGFGLALLVIGGLDMSLFTKPSDPLVARQVLEMAAAVACIGIAREIDS